MESLGNLLDQMAQGLTGTGPNRIKYMPYAMDVALMVVERIGKSFNEKFRMTPRIKPVYEELIRYFHADPDFKGDLSKGILLMGPSGTGKTLAMNIMKVYRKIDDTKIIVAGKPFGMDFDIVDTPTMVNKFMENAFDGLHVFCNRYVMCVDDIGTESDQVKHYGNCLDVVSHVLSERYSKRLLTFGTTNFPVKVLEQKYDDRVVSRMYALFNFIEMVEMDFRKG